MSNIQIVSAACAGILHRGIFCQDAVSAARSSSGACAASLSDGGGSFAFASQASEFQAREIGRFFAENFDRLYETADLPAFLSRQLPRMLLQFSQSRGLPYEELGATLLVASVHKDRFLLFHLGDGAIFAVHTNRRVQRISGPENGLRKNITSFLNIQIQPGAGSFRVQRGPLRDIAALILTSDGLSDFLEQSPNLLLALSDRVMQGGPGCGSDLKLAVRTLAHQGEITLDDCSLSILAIRPHVYPDCLRELTACQAKILALVAQGRQPSSFPGKKKRSKLRRILRQLKKQGFAGQDLKGRFFVYHS